MPHRPEVEKVTGARGRMLGWAGGPGGAVVVATTGMLVARLDGRWRGGGWGEGLRGGGRGGGDRGQARGPARRPVAGLGMG